MLPGLGFTELMVLAVAALIIVGPKDLPMMMRRLGQFVGKGRAMAREWPMHGAVVPTSVCAARTPRAR